MDDNQTPYIMSTIDKLTIRYYENMLYEDYEEEISGEDIENDLGITQLQDQMSYSEETIPGMKKQFDSLLVPLYKRIFLDASRARSIFDDHFLHNPDFLEKIREAYDDITWGTKEDNPFVWRIYLTSSNSYKDFKCKTVSNFDLFQYYSNQPYPRFIWVLEIGTISTFSEQMARVEVLLDATSSTNSNTWAILSIGYKGHMVFVPYIVEQLNEKQISEMNLCHEENSTTQDYSSINWEDVSEEVKQKVLTEIFKSLYYKSNKFVGDTYKIFSASNLKEV